jgi:hypothetical protein
MSNNNSLFAKESKESNKSNKNSSNPAKFNNSDLLIAKILGETVDRSADEEYNDYLIRETPYR